MIRHPSPGKDPDTPLAKFKFVIQVALAKDITSQPTAESSKTQEPTTFT